MRGVNLLDVIEDRDLDAGDGRLDLAAPSFEGNVVTVLLGR
jgi:hypothetical protein